MRYQTSGALLLFLLAWAGCGDDSETSDGETKKKKKPPEPGPAYVIDVVVDANRNGVADANDPADQDAEETWDATTGAMFLPNLDDDDGDRIRDADDQIVNGGEDNLDLAPLSISACTECPEGSYGYLEIDAAAAANVRIYALDVETNTQFRIVAGETLPCTDEPPACAPVTIYELSTLEVQTGVQLAIEGRDVMRKVDGWNGYVDLKYSIYDVDGFSITSEANPDGIDAARMRVAPWQLLGNLSPFDRVWSSEDSAPFVDGVGEGADHAGVEYETYGNYGDQWTQDFFQTGFFSINRLDNQGNLVVHGMTVANARPWGRSNSDNSLPRNWLKKNYLGPDKATLVTYKNDHTGDTFDSHGNHDLIPAYTNGAESYPLGRIIHGSGILKETKDFYAAQLLQGPPLVVDTEWLLVGHVDEYLSYVPANTPRGWKLLVGSPEMGRQMLLDAQAAGNGATIMHEGKYWAFPPGPAAISIDDVLANTGLMEATQEAQAVIDDELQKVVDAVGLAPDEIIEMPFIFEHVQSGGGVYLLAYQPGTVNSLVMGNTIVIPKPFGPQIGGEDIFEADLEARLGTAASGLGSDGQGLDIFFADNWDLYHRLSGEVHCGTNPEASAPFSSVNWWETGR